MATSNSTLKNPSNSAAATPSEITRRINDTLRCLVIPKNPLCHSGLAVSTLEDAHEVMELLSAIELAHNCGDKFEMPESGRFAIGKIREMVQDAVKYAAELCDGEDNLRGAFDRGEYEKPAAALS